MESIILYGAITQNMTLAPGEVIFVYVDYTYAQADGHNVTVTADYNNIHREFNETDNSMTITG